MKARFGSIVIMTFIFVSTRILQRNKIKSITKKAFDGLEELEHAWFGKVYVRNVGVELGGFVVVCERSFVGEY